jgi:predicted permease
MHTTQSLTEGVGIMISIIMLVVLLKRFGILSKDDSLLFSKIVLKITLPAVIFSSLAVKSFNPEFLQMSGIMMIIELGMMLIAWLIAHLLRLERAAMGALILVSSFGMTSLLGYPIIRQVFPNNPMAMEEAVITSEFGVGLLLFILGPIIAMYYGSSKVVVSSVLQSVKKFFVSPVFVALILGLLFSLFPEVKNNEFGGSLLRMFRLIGGANLLMVALTIGLILEFKEFKEAYIFILIAVLLKLAVKPILAVALMGGESFTIMMREIVFIETALPSAILAVVYARQYNCRPDIVSKTIVVTLVISIFSLGGLFSLFF